MRSGKIVQLNERSIFFIIVTVLLMMSITIAISRKAETAAAAEKADLRRLDLSRANANDAYWARIDFSQADFFRASLSKTSFKEAELRHADVTGIKIDTATNFESAKVYGLKLDPENPDALKDTLVDVSRKGDGSSMKKLLQWLREGDNADG